MFNYYVTFTATNQKGQSGPGYAEIIRDKPIGTGKDVLEVARDIKKVKKYRGVIVQNWILLNN